MSKPNKLTSSMDYYGSNISGTMPHSSSMSKLDSIQFSTSNHKPKIKI